VVFLLEFTEMGPRFITWHPNEEGAVLLLLMAVIAVEA